MSTRTPVQTLLLVVGGVVLLGGLVCVVLGFTGAGSSEEAGGEDGSMMLFAAGGFAMVVGFGIVAVTRAAVLGPGGAPPRRAGPADRTGSGGRVCRSCGAPASASARYCESCGVSLA